MYTKEKMRLFICLPWVTFLFWWCFRFKVHFPSDLNVSFLCQGTIFKGRPLLFDLVYELNGFFQTGQSWNVTLTFTTWMGRATIYWCCNVCIILETSKKLCSIWDSQPNLCDLSISVKKKSFYLFFFSFLISVFLQAFITCAILYVLYLERKILLKLWNSKTKCFAYMCSCI